MDKRVKQIEAWAEDAQEEARKKLKEIEEGNDFPAEYTTEYPEYWQGRIDLMELLLLWIHTGETK
jgi:hypothetical protein